MYDQMSSGESKSGDHKAKSPDLKTVIPYVKRKVLQGDINQKGERLFKSNKLTSQFTD